MKRVTVQPIPTTLVIALVWFWMVVGVGTAKGQIVGYAPSQPSPLNPTGPNVYDPRFDRFTTGFGKPTNPNNEPPLANVAPAPNAAQFVATGFNLSGVGWLTTNPLFGVTMISPRSFVTAAHNGELAFLPGTTVTFFNGSASTTSTVTATVASMARVASTPGSTFPVTDVLLGTFTADVPSSITSYPISIGLRSQYIGQPVFMYDQFHRVGTNNVSLFSDNENLGNPSNINNSTNLVAYDFNPSGPAGETLLQTGDSGKPTFMIAGGQLTVLGTHSAIGMDTNGTQYSFDAFLPDYIAQLNALMVPTGYVVRVVPVPEPALALIAAALGTCVWTGWRRLRRDARRARAA